MDIIKGDCYDAGLWEFRHAEAMVRDGNVVNSSSPIITEHDAREIIVAYISSGGLFNLTDGQCHAIERWISKDCRALLEKLNTKHEGEK